MIITSPLLASYTNGNCRVRLYEDGTKIRTVPDGEEPAPEFPESIDLKITDRCNMGCPWCHESSGRDGRHADIDWTIAALGYLADGVEIAVGGGNPLDHPGLVALLERITGDGLIANLTVQMEHALQQSCFYNAARLYVHGLGISGSIGPLNHQLYPGMFPINAVYHAIAGVDRPLDYLRVPRLLILGYKRYGRGSAFWSPAVDRNLKEWRYWLKARLSREAVTSFDNLALEQLGVRSLIGEEEWAMRYMGDDGQFTMYLDAVKQEFAASSTSPRHPMGEMNIRQAFKLVRGGAR